MMIQNIRRCNMAKKKEKKIYRTGLYIRLSKADERKGRECFSESIENQKIILHEHLDTHDDEFEFYISTSQFLPIKNIEENSLEIKKLIHILKTHTESFSGK